MQSHVSAMVLWKAQQYNTFEIYKEECLPQIRHKKATKPWSSFGLLEITVNAMP